MHVIVLVMVSVDLTRWGYCDVDVIGACNGKSIAVATGRRNHISGRRAVSTPITVN